MTDADTDLARLARSGDRAAFEELVRRTARLVYARLYLETGDRHRAEDLTQETFLLAAKAVRKLADPAAFRPWLLTIARNAVIAAARADTRKKRYAGREALNAQYLPSPQPPPPAAAETEELRQRVLAVLRSLPAEYQLPLTLRFLAGADHETIETQLGLTNGALRGLLHRGLKMLRDRLPPDIAADFAARGTQS